MIEKLIKGIIQKQNPTVVGLDPSLQYLPDEVKGKCTTFASAARAIYDFNVAVIDGVCDLVPAVKVQIAYYEMYGVEGLKCFAKTIKYAKSKGLIVIADAKRNDIGSTAACYSAAFLGKTQLGDTVKAAFPSDLLTINGYLGVDGIAPFLADAKKYKKGVFVLVRTSNPSGYELQNLMLDSGITVYEKMGELVESWGADNRGRSGYSRVGAVVGATHREEAERLRGLLPHTFFLVPGYGAQGGKAADTAVCFDKKGLGAIVNSSRGIICAYKQPQYAGLSISDAARQAAIAMKKDLLQAIFAAKGIERLG